MPGCVEHGLGGGPTLTVGVYSRQSWSPYPTMVSEPRSAKSQKVVLGCVPRTEEVMTLFERLREEFPGAELEGLLAGAGEAGG
jgi:hypothetical protein